MMTDNDLRYLTDAERAAWVRCEAALSDRFSTDQIVFGLALRNLPAALAEIARLRKTLRWYADPSNWHEGIAGAMNGGGWAGPDYQDAWIDTDDGERAREALSPPPASVITQGDNDA
jgi:hypothetical protein